MSPPVALADASALPAAAGLLELLPGEAAPGVLTLHRSVCSPGISSQEVVHVGAEQAYVRTPLYSHLGTESVRKSDFYGLTIVLTSF